MTTHPWNHPDTLSLVANRAGLCAKTLKRRADSSNPKWSSYRSRLREPGDRSLDGSEIYHLTRTVYWIEGDLDAPSPVETAPSSPPPQKKREEVEENAEALSLGSRRSVQNAQKRSAAKVDALEQKVEALLEELEQKRAEIDRLEARIKQQATHLETQGKMIAKQERREDADGLIIRKLEREVQLLREGRAREVRADGQTELEVRVRELELELASYEEQERYIKHRADDLVELQRKYRARLMEVS